MYFFLKFVRAIHTPIISHIPILVKNIIRIWMNLITDVDVYMSMNGTPGLESLPNNCRYYASSHRFILV